MKTIKTKYGITIPRDYTGIVEWEDGDVWWLKNGKQHRTDGPAVIWNNGKKKWYVNNKLHRIEGPAIECADGSVEYWINDKKVTKEAQEMYNWLFPKEQVD